MKLKSNHKSEAAQAAHPCCGAQRPESVETLGRAEAIVVKANAVSSSSSIPLPGGRFLMGADYAEGFPADGEGPVREVTLRPFAIDASPVTNARFTEFAASTGYRTDAERFGWSFVFAGLIPKKRYKQLVEDTVAAAPWWCRVRGASWNHPEGPQSSIQERSEHPVVHVSWNDAINFCAWSGQRLPTEAEWEYAARGGLEQKLYPWGDTLRINKRHMCNIWQGTFPEIDLGDDGYKGTCPVTTFPPNAYGLYSVAGNVWEWCADWFIADHGLSSPIVDPVGPPTGVEKVMKGGSFLCHHSYCNRYRVAARTANSVDSSTSNIGFRCVLP